MTSSIDLLVWSDFASQKLSRFFEGFVEIAGTYLVHSTVLIGGVWIASRIVRWRKRSTVIVGMRPATVERMWKTAAVLALLTAPISVLAGCSRPIYEWSVLARSQRVVATPNESLNAATNQTQIEEGQLGVEDEQAVSVRSNTDPPIAFEMTSSSGVGSSSAQVGLLNEDRTSKLNHDRASESLLSVDANNERADVHFADTQDSLSIAIDTPKSRLWQLTAYWPGIILVVWIVVGTFRLIGKSMRMSRLLSACQPIDGDLRHVLDRIVPDGLRIRLLRSFSPAVEPFACGLWHGIIVLPDGIEQQLTQKQLRALLAHEVAHLIRRDPLWLWFGEFLCTCLAFQPLNFLARRRWQQASELLCDDWAIEQHASPTALASCLTKIAEWKLDRQTAAMSLPAVGSSGLLLQRIEWLLRKGRAVESKRFHGRSLATLAVFAAGVFIGIFGPRPTFSVPLDAADDTLITQLWSEIDGDLQQTLDDFDRVESVLKSNPDPEIALMAKRLQQQSTTLKERSLQINKRSLPADLE